MTCDATGLFIVDFDSLKGSNLCPLNGEEASNMTSATSLAGRHVLPLQGRLIDKNEACLVEATQFGR